MISTVNQNFVFLFHLPMHKNKNTLVPPNPFSVSLKVGTFRSCKTTHLHFPAFSPSNSIHSSRSPKRVSRVVRTEAQRVLMDYLHSTRGYTFLDAEYISKNSPRFVEGLVSKIEGQYDDDVARALRKFLRYNPINEFEPFFESLGINPSELYLVLPPDIIFLDDDYMLLDNFHTMCNYGIPRNRMGKIYKGAKEIFGYASGLLLSKFRVYEDLGLSRSSIIKLVVCCPSLLVGDINSVFLVVLDWLKKIGIENDWILNYMSCSRTYNWKRMIDSMQFLHEVGYSEKEMHNLFKENPRLLLEGFGKNLCIFLDRSLKMGLKMNVIYSNFIEHPHILSNKCAKNLLRVVEFLCFIGMGSDDIVYILSNYMHILSTHSLKGPTTVCRELKVEKDDLCQIIKDDPLKLISMASKLELKSSQQISSGHDPCKHLEKTTFLRKLGYAENSEEMAKALKMFRGRGDQLQERFDCLVEAGLDYNSAVEMVRRAPMILNQKKVVIEKKIDFLTNILGYPLECVLGFPSYFCYNLDKLFERFSMYAWLKERNAVNPAFTLSNIVSSNDKRFVKYFVNVHPEGPTIWKGIKSLSSKDKILYKMP